MEKLTFQEMESIEGGGAGACAYAVTMGILGIASIFTPPPVSAGIYVLGLLLPPDATACDYID